MDKLQAYLEKDDNGDTYLYISVMVDMKILFRCDVCCLSLQDEWQRCEGDGYIQALEIESFELSIAGPAIYRMLRTD